MAPNMKYYEEKDPFSTKLALVLEPDAGNMLSCVELVSGVVVIETCHHVYLHALYIFIFLYIERDYGDKIM